MNANYAIYDIIFDAQVNRVATDEDPWFNRFEDEGNKIYDDIKKRKIVFRDQVSPSDSGISKPTRVAGSSLGTMDTNWDNSYGDGFRGADFGRTWNVEITGTGTSGGLFESVARWSNDDEQSFSTLTTGFEWNELQDQVFVRFKKGTASGTTNIFAIGDKWQFTTEPIRRQVGGQGNAKSY